MFNRWGGGGGVSFLLYLSHFKSLCHSFLLINTGSFSFAYPFVRHVPFLDLLFVGRFHFSSLLFRFSFPFSPLLSLSSHSSTTLLFVFSRFQSLLLQRCYLRLLYSFLFSLSSTLYIYLICLSPHSLKMPKCESFDLLDSHDFIRKAPMGRRLQDCNKKFKRLSFYGFEVCSAKILRCTLNNLGEIGQK